MIRKIFVLFFVFSILFTAGYSGANAITLPEKNPVFGQTHKTSIPDGLKENPLYFDVTGLTLVNSYYFSNATQEKKNAFVQCMLDYALGIRHDVPAGTSEINHALDTCNPEDEHDYYFTKEEWERSNAVSFGGVGIQIKQDKDEKGFFIEKIFDDSSLQGMNVHEGDEIRAVKKNESGAFVSLAGKTIEEAIDMIRGKKGTSVSLEIWREGKRLGVVTVVRKEIDTRHIVVKVYSYSDQQIGYMQFSGFEEKMFEERIRPVIDLFKQQGIHDIIIDVRGNPGGLLIQALWISGEFVGEENKVILKTCHPVGNCVLYKTKRKGNYADMKTVVLVDKGSASASEILAGILQIEGAKIIGEQTYGKGSVQGIFSVSQESKIKLTIALYYFENDFSPDKKGITPDTKISRPDSQKGKKIIDVEDEVLQKALEYLRTKPDNQ